MTDITVLMTCTPPTSFIFATQTPAPLSWSMSASDSTSIPYGVAGQNIVYSLEAPPISSVGVWQIIQSVFVVSTGSSAFSVYSTGQHQGLTVGTSSSWGSIKVIAFEPSAVTVSVTNSNTTGSNVTIGVIFVITNGNVITLSPDPQIVLEPNNVGGNEH